MRYDSREGIGHTLGLMTPLPIDAILPEVVESLRMTPSLVLVAPPGAGKTTRVPPAILKAGLLTKEHPRLIMLQPRRVAARASAQRIADENGWTLGEEVGYHIRFDRKLSPNTPLRVVTEGILTRQLIDDPFLESVGCVILDEFHERSLHTDLALSLLREIQQTVREDLRIVVMSATLHAEPVSKFLNGCPILHSEGRTFPVEVQHTPTPRSVDTRSLPADIVQALTPLLDDPQTGDILVFLPGVHQINQTHRVLEPLADRYGLLVIPLHGSLTGEEQFRALRPSALRKVILATNIAETSLTIDGVRTVIDSGLARVACFDPARGVDHLELQRISKASATQRAGRAGRTAPGRAIRLWSARQHADLPDFQLPEIHRVDLASTLLSLHAWGHTDARKFPWFDPPPERTIAAAEKLLHLLEAVDPETGKITPVGQTLLTYPAHPRLGRLLAAAIDAHCPHEGAALAAILSEKDFLFSDRSDTPSTRGPSDLLLRLDLLHHPHHPNIDRSTFRQVLRIRDELLRLTRAERHKNPPPDEQTLLRLLLLAYPDRVCRRRGADPRSAVMVGGMGVRLAGESIVTDAEFFLALDLRRDQRSQRSEALVHIASQINPDWLPTRSVTETVYDADRQRVVARRAVYYEDLLVREDRDAPVTAEAAGPVLAAALQDRAGELIRSDESAASLLARVALLRQHMPEHPWPAFDDAELQDVLAEACQGRKSLAELQNTQWPTLLLARLPYPFDRLLDQHAPTHITVPTGNRIRIDYSVNPPVLAVRLQEIFGVLETPRIAGGRLPLLLHLLAPNYRPVQITTDLASFWSTAYFQVRKDLRTRYPKHAWPEDPLTATPQAKGRPHR